MIRYVASKNRRRGSARHGIGLCPVKPDFCLCDSGITFDEGDSDDPIASVHRVGAFLRLEVIMLELDGTDDDFLPAGFAEPAAPECISCEPPRLKVLIVADDAADSLLIERCLEHMVRYEPQITTAGTLAAASFAAVSDDFDAILLDYDMPGIRGTELTVTFGSPTDRCPAVMLTRRLSPEFEREALSLGAAACLAKSGLTAKGLETTIHQAVRAHAEYCTLMALAVSRIGPAAD